MIAFVCEDCRAGRYEHCRQGTWCDCRRRPPQPAESDAAALSEETR